MLDDVRYALRLLRRAPLFTAAAVLTLALGNGANTAIYSVVHAVLLRALPFAEPDRLVQIAEKNDRLNIAQFGASVLNYLSWVDESQAFTALGAVGAGSFAVGGEAAPEQIAGATITPSLIPLLGVNLVAGRTFRAGEDAPGAPPVVIVSETLWRRKFGADPALVGRSLRVNGVPTEVIGIAPSTLTILTSGDMWAPLTIDRAKERRLSHVITVFGRLKPGVTLSAASADMAAVNRHMVAEYPEIKDWGVTLVSMRDTLVSSDLRTGLVVLMAAVIAVLLIACANVASLLLARATVRQREIAIRSALGASRARVLRQLLVESVVLSTVGGAAGLLGAAWTVRWIGHALPPTLLPVPDIGIDASVMAFTILATIGTGLFFGIAPAFRAAGASLTSVLGAGGRASSSVPRSRARHVLVTIELALATLLLVGAALLGRSLLNLQRATLGFTPDGVMTFQLAPAPAKYPTQDAAIAFYRTALATIQSMPGVLDAANSSALPFGNGGYTRTPVMAVGASVLPPDTPLPIDWRAVSPTFFHTMQIPLLRGRVFSEADGHAAPSVMVVSQLMATRLWGEADPLGREILRVADKRTFTVIGVVGDVRNVNLNQLLPTMYYSSDFRVWPTMDIAVRTSAAPSAILPAIRERLKAMDPDMPTAFERTMSDWIAANAAQPRLDAMLLLVFAAVALAVACVGVYAVLAYSVAQRTSEIGLRLALGATRASVIRLILREGLRLTIGGLAIGVGAALLAGRVLQSLVYDVSTKDPASFALVTAILAAVAIVACVIPGWRAARIDTADALRAE